MSYKYPGNFARFYDLIYQRLRDGVDNDFFINEISRTNGKILEVGAGTGRLFTNALEHGADIYGIDISPSMIGILLEKIPPDQHNRISIQDIIDFEFGFKFDLMIAPFHMFMHLLEKKDQIRAVNNIYDHLNPGGRFIFDVFVPDLNLLLNGIDNQTDFEGEYEPGKRIKRIVTTTPDLITQIIDITFHLEWDEGYEVRHEDWKLPFRFFFRYELEHLVERTKFEKYSMLGDYLGGELNKTSREFIIICQKQ